MAQIKLNATYGLTGTLPAVSGANLTSLPAQGITEADMWRVTTAFTGDAEPIASNWERNDLTGFDKIGTGMTESSGIFTFPSTGIYQITFYLGTYMNGDNAYSDARIQITTDNSSYSVASSGWGGAGQASGTSTYHNSTSQCIFDVTSTSTHKVRFDSRVGNNSTSTWGDTNENHTYVTFLRLGDT